MVARLDPGEAGLTDLHKRQRRAEYVGPIRTGTWIAERQLGTTSKRATANRVGHMLVSDELRLKIRAVRAPGSAIEDAI